MKKALPGRDILLALFSYDPDTGVISRRTDGREAGRISRQGYRRVRVAGGEFQAQRLIWRMMTGDDPSLDIDHINGSAADNRWNNLRLATRQQNIWNTPFTGASLSRDPGRKTQWRARLWLGKSKSIHLGYFATKDEARAVTLAAARERRGEFVREEG